MRFFYVIILFLVCQSGSAQSNWRIQQLALQDTLIIKDTLTIIPEGIEIFSSEGDTIATQNYFFRQGKIFFQKDFLAERKKLTEIKVKYRVLPFLLEKTFTHLDSSRLQPKTNRDEWQFKPNINNPNDKVLPNNKDLNYSGGLTRGVSVGNNQNLVLNSNFNLQMSGKLSNDVEINAAISDNNIPIQPDGNTAQLNQFDRIFIQFKRKENQLNAGDFDLQRPESYFINYNKRVQGLSVQHVEKVKKGQWSNKAVAAVSRGKFVRQQIQSIEGNQGPYRLQGNGGEQFIIVISGTERIYIDGILLKRGFDNDYIMDYNQGTLVFTPKRLITKDSRIVAEFDYTDQSFVRSLYTVSSQYKSKRWRVHFDIYGEQDSRSSGTQQALSVNDRKALNDGGDKKEIFSNGVDTLKKDEIRGSRLWYKKAINPDGKTYFIFSQNPDSAIYRLSLLEVAQGEGDYIIKLTSNNGRVYEYAGEGRGNFRLGSKLITPKLIQNYSLGADYQLFKSKKSYLKSELICSRNDLNRLSIQDKGNDLGFAAMLQFNHSIALSKRWNLNVDAAYEGTQQNFRVLNPYRPVEFLRDWNTDNNSNYTEHIFKNGLSLSNDSVGTVRYELNRFVRPQTYEGNKHFAQANLTKRGWTIDAAGSFLNTITATEQTSFIRPKIEVRKVFKQKISAILYAESEKNQRRTSDTLSRASFDFQILRAQIELPQKKGFQLKTFVQERKDYLPQAQTLTLSSTARELHVNGNYRNKKGISAGANVAYRNLNINNAALAKLVPQETYLGRIDASLSKFKGALFTSSIYELGSGQEQRVEYFFQKVAPGLGNLSWRDNNKDGNIQQDEIFPAIFQDSANIVRIILPTNQFVKTNNIGFTQALQITPKQAWNDKKGVRKFLTHISSESYWQIQNKVKLRTNNDFWNPLNTIDIKDTTLVSGTSTNRHTLYILRNHQKFELSGGTNNNTGRTLLTTGFDIRAQKEDFVRIRWNMSKIWSSRLMLTQNIKIANSEFFPLRNYEIVSKNIEPETTFFPNRNFRLKINYKWTQSVDTLASDERATIQDLNSEITYNYKTKTALRLRLSFVNIDYQGTPNPNVQYIMLNALQPGQNFLWGLQFNQAINKTLQLEFRYDGRKVGEASRIVHTGNMAFRALF